MPSLTTECLGIHQSDLIIQSAIEAAFEDLRAEPKLLDWCFQSLAQDLLTRDQHGQAEIDAAKKWFLATKIPIFLNLKKDPPSFPCVSIHIMASREVDAEATLGDTHSTPLEDNDDEWVTLAGPLDPTAYDPVLGVLTFSQDDLGQMVLGRGMVLLTRTGQQVPLIDTGESNEALIAPGTVASFSQVVVKASRPGRLTELESASFREVYAIGCHAQSEAIHAIVLHSLLIFALLRYRQDLLEARGFERSSLDSQNLRLDEEGMGLPEFLYTRYCQVSGYVRQYWPKSIAQKIVAVTTTLLDADTGLDLDNSDVQVDVVFSGARGPAQQSQVAYWGAVPIPGGGYTAGWVAGLTPQSPAVGVNVLFNALPGQFLHYVVPAIYGITEGDFEDDETDLGVGVSLVAAGVVVNGVALDVWRSNQPNLGLVGVNIRKDC